MLNHFAIQGRLTRDVELRHTQSNTAVASFTLAWSETYKEREQKLFMPCVAWGKTGEFVSRFFVKGQETIAEGKLITRKWEDKNGNPRETVELIVDKMHFCGPKKESSNGGGYDQAGYNQYSDHGFTDIDVDDGDLPF